jgi:hypothetical protein
MVHAGESFERDPGRNQSTCSRIDVVNEPPGVRASRLRNRWHDRESKGRATRIDDDGKVILVTERQPEHTAIELLRTSCVRDEQEPDERPSLKHAGSLGQHRSRRREDQNVAPHHWRSHRS